MQDIFQILVWVLSPLLILLILLQGGAGDVSSAFGGGGQLDSALGVGANRKMSKITGWMAAGFLLMVLILAIRNEGSFATPGGAAPDLGVQNTGEVLPPAMDNAGETLDAPAVDAPAVDAPAVDAPAEPTTAPEANTPEQPVDAPAAETEGSGVTFETEETDSTDTVNPGE